MVVIVESLSICSRKSRISLKNGGLIRACPNKNRFQPMCFRQTR